MEIASGDGRYRLRRGLLGNLELKVKTFCAIPQVLAFLKDYIVFAEKDEELNKYILRQHQTGAVEATVSRALDPKRTRGLVWHTQGSGKTFTMIKAAERLVAEHYRENVEPLGYKAFLVGVDREACAHYKHALDQFLPPEYSEVVYTGSNNDSALLKEFHLDPKKERQIRKSFGKLDQMPKILIVTEKLLTGFDAPVLYANHGKLWKMLMRAHLGNYEEMDDRLRAAADRRSKYSCAKRFFARFSPARATAPKREFCNQVATNLPPKA